MTETAPTIAQATPDVAGRDASARELLRWIREAHPDLWALADEVDVSLLAHNLRLDPAQRWQSNVNLVRLRGLLRAAPGRR